METRKSNTLYMGKPLYNDTDVFVIVDKVLRIEFFEFIATDFVDYFIRDGKNFAAYLRRRKELICESHGLNPDDFGISYKNYYNGRYGGYLM